MEIIPLGTQARHAEPLAALHAAEWGHHYAGWDAATVLAEFAVQHSDGRLPTTLVAVAGETLLGSVSLIFDDLPGWEHLNPWLASFYVLPGYRRQGIGGQLLRAAEETLRTQGNSTAYLFTEARANYFAAHGWLNYRETRVVDLPVMIMQRLLAPP
jgi:predicted N-acetyltransferase YhbS